jgi:hypothetical protein
MPELKTYIITVTAEVTIEAHDEDEAVEFFEDIDCGEFENVEMQDVEECESDDYNYSKSAQTVTATPVSHSGDVREIFTNTKLN